MVASCSSGGRTKRTTKRIQSSEIIRRAPIDEVPGWLENQSAPKPEAVAPALNITALVKGERSSSRLPARQAITK